MPKPVEESAAPLKPRRGLTISELLRLKTTECQTARSWLHLSHTGEILLRNQRVGHPATGGVRLTRAEFEKFWKFYDRALKLSRGGRDD